MLSRHPIDVILEVSALDAARAFYERLALEIVRDAQPAAPSNSAPAPTAGSSS